MATWEEKKPGAKCDWMVDVSTLVINYFWNTAMHMVYFRIGRTLWGNIKYSFPFWSRICFMNQANKKELGVYLNWSVCLEAKGGTLGFSHLCNAFTGVGCCCSARQVSIFASCRKIFVAHPSEQVSSSFCMTRWWGHFHSLCLFLWKITKAFG